jgi:hypothetical protein
MLIAKIDHICIRLRDSKPMLLKSGSNVAQSSAPAHAQTFLKLSSILLSTSSNQILDYVFSPKFTPILAESSSQISLKASSNLDSRFRSNLAQMLTRSNPKSRSNHAQIKLNASSNPEINPKSSIAQIRLKSSSNPTQIRTQPKSGAVTSQSLN